MDVSITISNGVPFAAPTALLWPLRNSLDRIQGIIPNCHALTLRREPRLVATSHGIQLAEQIQQLFR
jgi:hypothetical protein